MELVITPQEKSLISAVNNLHPSDITITIEPCAIGDGCIRTSDSKIVYIFERKAKGDLLASIKDGRYKEQKSRLLATGLPPRQCIFIIEDLEYPSSKSAQQRDRLAIWSSITNSFHRDGFTVFLTKNPTESATYLLSLLNSASKFEIGAIDEVITKPIITNDVKKSSVDKSNWFIQSLTLISNVSEEIAKAIVKQYPTLTILLEAMDENGKEFLADIRHGKTERRIGKKLSVEICDILDANY